MEASPDTVSSALRICSSHVLSLSNTQSLIPRKVVSSFVLSASSCPEHTVNMTTDRRGQDLSEKRDLLHRLQENYRRLKAYLALATHDIEELEKDRDARAREGRASKRARTRGFRRPSEREGGRATLDLLNRKIASYRGRIRRTSVQLLVAAAAGHQYRETNLATKQGDLIKGISPGVLRKYRAFDARSTASLTSNEAAARAAKNWINRRKAGLDSDSDFDSDSSISDGNNSSTLSSLTHSPIAIGDDDDDEDGSSMVKMAMAMIAQPLNEGSPLSGGEPVALSQTPDRPYRPIAEDPKIYNPRLWKNIHDIDVDWLKDDITKEKYKNRPDHTPVGPRTWKEQEKDFPVLNSIFRMRKKEETELWDPIDRIQEENMSSKHPPLEADINTLLSLERQNGFGWQEVSPLYFEYSRLPLDLPEKLSEERMRRGPLPVLPPLPLISGSGREVKLSRVATPPFTSDRAERRDNFLNMADDRPLPVAQYHYPIDSPTVSAFRFSDGRQVSDILQPGPLDEPRQVRGSQAIVDYGREVENQTAHLKEPYHPEGLPPRPPPDFIPEDNDIEMTEVQKKRNIAMRKKAEEEAKKRLPEAIARANAKRRAARTSQGKQPSREDKISEKLYKSLIDKAKVREAYVRQRDAGSPFWHFEDVKDSESHLHNDNKPGDE
ncbi:hypothetical protein F4805DRAFT_136732 [Annulohypoxylon moriforme]|nr:hypothetical protein F4805DRAFT_136732 [Annulohypoxylon moriforme]